MIDLTADCSKCYALCCWAFAFEPSPEFAEAKAAGTACHHLDQDNGCKIHADREEQGYRGCIAFDCLGAGQRISQEVFPDQHWRDAPHLTRRMIDAFRIMRKVHRQYQLVDLSGALPLSARQAEERDRLLLVLGQGWTETTLLELDGSTIWSDCEAFFIELRAIAASPSAPTAA